MAVISGAWRTRAHSGEQITATQWGTGWNRVHGSHYGGRGRNTAPQGNTDFIDPYVLGDLADNDYGYCDEDSSSIIWGYGVTSGTADRPGLEETHDLASGYTSLDGTPYPSWGSVGQGEAFRALDHGAERVLGLKQVPLEDVAQGWVNKDHSSEELTAGDSDVSQLLVQTSHVQREAVRSGSQTERASEYDAPIASRLTGPKIKDWTDPDSSRHEAMSPFQQDLIIRPWFTRTFGAGKRDNMRANELYVSEPLDRVPPAEAYTGRNVGDGEAYGYTAEDGFF